MPERRVVATKGKEIGDYRHEDATRLNNPTAALAREDVAPIPERTSRPSREDGLA
jgi:hypothetical protein